ncbi:LysM peptidoglycan-binding domain-containing protein [Levilactobacillus brevis]|jgi:murein DD-endopeptidase MepM/ murein hydrolase activator NlpD|uniref:Aggregation promoting factrelated surface protein n=3 Tax=Levilactobacillus brevis TaxID=1580 RepID=Q03U28_LEVBA|nr:LysM domain-containing protein [Levilactobacillus brevis]MBL3536155.1 LysM peptidoglycan-binding domain-containing protein [Lactobacillus sp. GPR40-2]MBL3629057.1 LysM peptidoglycan-binding domain-containing protein [Lactobacillus sp. GPB7-4]ABJ63294.1 Aggregation promoting factrelated surface protein [Levilactobacillus brevis ATCC 367]ARQ93043.1 peptidoglycan-binding protein LysM [Levilactobacillus brevis]ARW21041.1 Platelet binding protein GspB [Levilactobacillus brevis]
MNIKKVLVSTLGTAAVLGAGLFASTTSANADVRVTVKSGDTVAKIANQYNSSVSAIETANSLKNVNLIYVGESLSVPNSTTAASTTAATTATTQSQSTTPAQSTTTTSNSANTATNYSGTASHTTATTGTTSTNTAATTSTSGSTSSAKSWIANKESGGSYTASNGNYYGKYQLTKSLLNGDYSAANQEKVANSYVSSRYGSWAAAKSFWQANGWY